MVVRWPSEFQAVVGSGGHLAVHTWSRAFHCLPPPILENDSAADPYMTTLSDLDIVAELGWTMQIIFDRTGKLPAFWRPPYGEVDDRVRSIASNVFRLQTVMWSHDPHGQPGSISAPSLRR